MRGSLMVMADPHFHNWKSHTKTEMGINSRLYDTLKACETAAHIAESQNCTAAAIAGDIFHVRGSMRPSVVNCVVKFIERLLLTMDTMAIPGNHDMEMFNGGATAVDFMEALSPVIGAGDLERSIKIANRPMVYSIGGWDIAAVPYIHDSDNFKAEFESIATVSPKDAVFLIHQGIDNFKGEPGLPDTGVTADYLKSVAGERWVFAGHYHAAQQNEHIVSIGTPLQHTFADEGRVPGIWILHADGKTAQFYAVSDSPRFITIETDSVKTLAARDDIAGNILRIKTSNAKVAEKIRAKADELGAYSVSMVVEREHVAAHEKVISISTPRKMLLDYLSMVDIYKDKIDQIMDIYDKVMK